ncbi:Ubiquitin-conjugating enzyme E2 32 [Acorus calamus]|uniref:Ubiquitin-conjugating enzyme E2 32 n=1 Tax=Acorus calamus TaxID=4465 RepID=A0AAV9CTL2_ACOCL|nr:Ubiquitin-conjugating enzyme E2 32 [Acorus calamus]
MAEEKYNMKNPSVKRILQELKEMQSNPSADFISLPLEDNIFEWQFAIKGPCETEFEGGIYHGRIQLPAEYPFKPPSFMLLTPSGRFETQTKICLSISNYHPEHWQPSWSVRTALVALIAFMPTNGDGALGSLDYKKEERRALAIKSREAAPKFGTADRQKIIDEIHEYMLSKVHPIPQPPTPPTLDDTPNNAESEGNAAGAIANLHELHVNADASPVRVSFTAGLRLTRRVPRSETETSEQPPRPDLVARKPDDRLFTWAALGLTFAILVLILKKFLKSNGYVGYVGGL